jgi:hypothetical protein
MSQDWTWELLDAQGMKVDVDMGSSAFPTQSEAESWLGEEWRTLLDAGVEAVNLKEGDTLVYGPMSLNPAQ